MKYVVHIGQYMPRLIALFIQQLRTGNPQHSWRRIAEIVCETHPEFIKEFWHCEPTLVTGNQLLGRDLCEEAADRLKVPAEIYERDWS